MTDKSLYQNQHFELHRTQVSIDDHDIVSRYR